jgi:tetratricopeptide (TPR) repeat protein
MPAETRSDALLVQLAELHRARKTGSLVVKRGAQCLVVELRQGQIAGVEFESLAGAGETEDPAEPLVLDGLDLAGDPGLAREAARERLLKALTWTDVSSTFTEGAQDASDPPLALSTEEVLGEALPLIQDPAIIRATLGNLDRILGLAFDPSKPRNLTLTPTEGYLLSRIDGSLSAREVLQLIPMDPVETERSLFRLLLNGLVEYLALPARPRVPPPEMAPPLNLDLHLDAEETPAVAAAPSARAAGERSRLSPAVLAAARQEIESAFTSKVDNRNHFEVLELERSADAAAVKAAYFRLAKRFHADAQRDPGVDDLKDKLSAVFLRLGGAYEILGNPRKRADYESNLPRRSMFNPPRAGPGSSPAKSEPPGGSGKPTGPAGPAHTGPRNVATAGWSEPAPHEPESEEDLALRETEILTKAAKLMTEEKYWDAIQALEVAVASFTGRRLQKARLLLARAYAKNPKWQRRAEEVAQKVVKDEPANAEAYLVLGGIYKAGRLESRATAMYRKVLELKPENEEARAALGEVDPPKASGTLLNRLFRKP